MAFIKEKNLITYTGRKYKITFNIADGSLITNHPDGVVFIQQTAKRDYDDLAKLIYIVANADEPINPFIETIMVAAPKLWKIISRTRGVYINNINELITLAKQNWKIVLELEKRVDETPYGGNYYEATQSIKVMSLGLNELERKWYLIYENIPFVKKFAGQLEMYSHFLSYQGRDLISWYNVNNIDITPYLINKNLLQVLGWLESNKDNMIAKKHADGLIATYEKYKSLESIDADGWSYQILNTYEQFKQEAKQMHNCLIVGKYLEKMSDGQCVIVVATTPDGQRIDVELKPRQNNTMYISQAYYKNDCGLTEEHTIHLRKWVDGLHF